METKNIYHHLLNIVEQQTSLSKEAIRIALKHYDKHEELRNFAREQMSALRDKKERTVFEESCYKELERILLG